MPVVPGADVSPVFTGGSGQPLQGTLTWDTGLGAITHIQYPGDAVPIINGGDAGGFVFRNTVVNTLFVDQEDDTDGILRRCRFRTTVISAGAATPVNMRFQAQIDASNVSTAIVGTETAVDLELQVGSVTVIRLSASGDSVMVGTQTGAPDSLLELAEDRDEGTGTIADAFSSALTLDPAYNGTDGSDITVTRHNYIDVQDVSAVNSGAGNYVIGDGCVFRFDAAAGTHVAVDSGTTKTSPGTVDAWVKINLNGTVHYIPSYTSKTT